MAGGRGAVPLKNIVSISGGKDSTALLLLALERETPNMEVVFADTGHEHAQTYDYVRYLEEALNVPIRWVRADFRMRIANKREFIVKQWAKDGVPQSHIDRALELLVPTGNPFLDLCMLSGRFPSTKARFCTMELKHAPITQKVMAPALRENRIVFSWQGVRRQESLARAKLYDFDLDGDLPGIVNYRPILRWTVEEVFAFHRRHGIKHNPLYEQGMGRVGCMPCIHARKDELREIGTRFPEEIARVAQWEKLVSQTSKQGASTFRTASSYTDQDITLENVEAQGIWQAVEWAKTSRGGKQYDLITSVQEPTQCSSIYGLCE